MDWKLGGLIALALLSGCASDGGYYPMSTASYAGSCACPDNYDSAGRRCGARSAYSRSGGAAPACYGGAPSSLAALEAEVERLESANAAAEAEMRLRRLKAQQYFLTHPLPLSALPPPRPNCMQDCSGHEAGHEWAEDNGITDPDDCGGNSQSFIEGCQEWAEENRDDDP